MKFVIDRSKWRCGGNGLNSCGFGPTNLLNNQKYMCCLGQMCVQLGIKEKDISNHGNPEMIHQLIPILTKKTEYFDDDCIDVEDTRFASLAININDDELLTPEERERKLKSLASKFKHTITFKGKYK